MIKRIHRIAFLAFVFIPLVSLQAQQTSRDVRSRARDLNKAVFLFENFSSANDNWHIVKRATSQNPQTATSTASNNNGYVFPSSTRRFHRYVRSIVGPIAFFKYAASAGIEQWDNSPDEWGQGMRGYGKRFASNIGSSAIQQTTVYAMSEALHLDAGFEKSKHTKFWPRVGDALIVTITSRTRSGKRVLSAPILVGTYVGAIIPVETWYPDRYNYKDGIRGGSYTLLAGFGYNLIREFIFNW